MKGVEGLDKFYTRPSTVEMCLSILFKYASKESLFIEPSAGSGAFSAALPGRVKAYDIAPQAAGIEQLDFLTGYARYYTKGAPVVFVGNPPYGRNANLAIQFMNRAAEYSPDYIGFVLPKTFGKQAIQDKINLHYKLVKSVQLPPNSFIENGTERNVPSVFQVWRRLKHPRKLQAISKENPLVDFTTGSTYDFAMRRAGSRAGEIKDEYGVNVSGWYYLVEKFDGARQLFEQVDWMTVGRDTVGQPSISKTEISINL